MADGYVVNISSAPPPDAHGAPAPQPRHDPRRPLFRALPAAPVFPMRALLGLLPAAEAIHQHTQAPQALCAQSVLAAACLAIQAHHDVQLPGMGRKPLTGLFLTVAESGERKSSVDRLALSAVRRIEGEWRQAAEAQKFQHGNALEAWKTAREAAKKAHAKSQSALLAALDAIGPEPKAPPSPMLLVADPTPEALVLHLAGRPWGGVFTAEGGLLVGGAAFSDEIKMRTGALLNVLWDGEPIRRLRVLTGTAYLPGRRCSLHIMMQPNVAARLLADQTLEALGALARMLVAAPDSAAGTRLWRAPPPRAADDLAAYDERLLTWLRRPPALIPDTDALDPAPIGLDQEACQALIAFHDQVETNIGPGGEYAPIRAFACKLAEHAGRLAALLQLYGDPEADAVTGETMAAGIGIARYYAAEMLRLAGAAAIAPDLALAARLLAWLQARDCPSVHLAEIYKNGPSAIRDAATARRIVTVLEEHGWVSRLRPGTEIEGATRKEAWMMVEI